MSFHKPFLNFKNISRRKKLNILLTFLLLGSIPVTVFAVLKIRSLQTPAAATPTSTPLINKQDIVVLGERKLCSFVSANQQAVGIFGEDGGESVRVGNTTYFAFGDTNTTIGQLPNSVATTTDLDAGDCFTMTSKSSGGVAVPMLPKLSTECTVWPLDMVNTSGNDIYFFYYSFSASNCSQRLGFGLGKMDAATLATTRINNFFWSPGDTVTPNFDIYGAAFSKVGTDIYILWNGVDTTGKDLNMLSKVPVTSIENKAAYTYWNGSSFQSNPALMVPLWNQGSIPTHGMTFRFNAFLNKWTTIYNTGYTSIMVVRTADSVTGPWSGETTIINCLQHYALGSDSFTAFPCYGGKEHPWYSKNNGQVIYTSHSNSVAYQPYLHEVIFGQAVNQWIDAQSNAQYALDSLTVGTHTLEGPAFYASPNPLTGFTDIYQWRNSLGETLLSPTSPGTGFTNIGRAFYAPTSKQFALSPIYRWDKGTQHRYSSLDLGAGGYSRGPIVFYAAVTNHQITDSTVYPKTGSIFQIGVKDSNGNWVSGAKLKEASFTGLLPSQKYSIVTNTPFFSNRFFGENLVASSGGIVNFTGDLDYVNNLNIGIFEENQALVTSNDQFTYWTHHTGEFDNPAEIGHQLNPYSKAGNFKSFFLTSAPAPPYQGVVCQPDCDNIAIWSGDVEFCGDNTTLTPTGPTICSQLQNFKIGNLTANTNYTVYYCTPNCEDDVSRIAYSKLSSATGEIAITQTNVKIGDINFDGSVNTQDLAILVNTWNSTTDLRADLNGDGRINAGDLAKLISRWGT